MSPKEALSQAGVNTQEFISDHRREVIVAGVAMTIAACILVAGVGTVVLNRNGVSIDFAGFYPGGMMVDVIGQCDPVAIQQSLTGYAEIITRHYLDILKGYHSYNFFASCTPQ